MQTVNHQQAVVVRVAELRAVYEAIPDGPDRQPGGLSLWTRASLGRILTALDRDRTRSGPLRPKRA